MTSFIHVKSTDVERRLKRMRAASRCPGWAPAALVAPASAHHSGHAITQVCRSGAPLALEHHEQVTALHHARTSEDPSPVGVTETEFVRASSHQTPGWCADGSSIPNQALQCKPGPQAEALAALPVTRTGCWGKCGYVFMGIRGETPQCLHEHQPCQAEFSLGITCSSARPCVTGLVPRPCLTGP